MSPDAPESHALAPSRGGPYDGVDDPTILFGILREAIDGALGSGVRETAESRYRQALACRQRLAQLGLPDEIQRELDGYVASLEQAFPTAWRANAALAEVERAGRATTVDAQREHLERAAAVLAEGLERSDVDADELGALARQVEQHLTDLGSGGLATIEAEGEADRPSFEGIDALSDSVEVETESVDVAIEIRALGELHAAMLRGLTSPVTSIELRLDSSEPVVDATLEVESEPAVLRPASIHVAELDGAEPLELGARALDAVLRDDASVLAALTERTTGTIRARLTSKDGAELASSSTEWTLHPTDSWIGATRMPELLATFVTPNDPAVEELLSRAAVRLDEATGDPAIDGYQSGDPARPAAVARAVYAAMQDAEITYASPPSGFEDDGQRIRFPSDVVRSRLGTCLDLTLFAAAALERAGLHPVVLLVEGHAFVCVWLVERTFASSAIDEATRVSSRVELTEILAFDPTMVASRPTPDFDASCERARELLADRDSFRVAVDVRRARLGGVLPIAQLAEDDGATATGVPQRHDRPSRTARDLDEALRRLQETERIRREQDETPETRLDRWLRQLLDLTMRNRLLHTPTRTKRALPLFGEGLAAVEDRLAAGKSFRIRPRPDELEGADPRDPKVIAQLAALVDDGVRGGKLYSTLAEGELGERLVNLFREARTASEEGGANSLFLAIGFLRFLEAPSSTKERRAPLLLVPVELRRKSARTGYTLVQGADEPRVNVTLLEYLRRDHGVDVLGVDPLPTDEHGIDVPLLLRAFRDAIKDRADWEVLDEGSIGLFSFSKHLLWRDLRDRAEVLRRSELVEHLLDRPIEPFAGDTGAIDPASIDDDERVDEVVAPLSYDSSQLAAMLAVQDGGSLVLEGPPGTGKSQTITNLIADAMSRGKTVLFVSEKMAALDVVQRRLKSLGLSTACLELHSNKAGKKGVLQQFADALDEGRVRGKRRREWDEINRDVAGTRASLNGHVRAIHDARSSGESIHDVVGRGASRTSGASSGSALVVGDPRAIDDATLANVRRLLDETDDVALRVGVGPDHPLRLVGRREYSPILEDDTRRAIMDFDAPAGGFVTAADELTSALDLDVPVRGEPAWRAVRELACRVAGFDELGPGAADAVADPGRMDAASELLARIGEADELRGAFDVRYRVTPLDLDLDALEGARRQIVGGGFFTRWRKSRELVAAFRGIANDPKSVRKQDVVAELDRARRLRELESITDEAARRTIEFLGGDPRRGLETAQGIARALADAAGALQVDSAVLANRAANAEGRADAAERAVAFDRAFAAYRDATVALNEAAAPRPDAPTEIATDDVASLRALARVWADGWGDLRRWCRWRELAHDLESAELAHVAAAVESGALAPGAVRATWDTEFDRAWALQEISSDERLRAFDGDEFDRSRERFREHDEERLSAAREEARGRVAALRPRAAEVDEAKELSPRSNAARTGLGLLQREITKKTRHLAIRRLLGELGELAMELKPCFLMSPMSVAQYLDAEHPPFDLVVFDEASQIPVWDAIGVLARGRQVVVVGDPKQLPPTSFFHRGEDESVDEDDVQDLESILDECLAIGVPTHRLTWHYRSRHESLIAFSNERYYDGRLTTFPAGTDAGVGVSARRVDGVYDKGRSRTNRAEAEAVVAEVIRRVDDGDERTIGIVTFGQPQQTLILDLFEEAFAKHAALEARFSDAVEEAVFVKNLENVQGDERDVILFSLGYGPDSRGRVSMNFGPLNKDGGERRLNVAITRARQEVCVFSSIGSTDIDLDRTSARGVHDLRAFLRYAERETESRSGSRTTAERTRARDVLVRAIADALEAKGWSVDTEVGSSDARIDLAVRDPRDPERWLAGILTDGEQYERAATARDRDRLRPDVLGNLGWSLERVWTVDWWRDAPAEVERLDAALRERSSGGEATGGELVAR